MQSDKHRESRGNDAPWALISSPLSMVQSQLDEISPERQPNPACVWTTRHPWKYRRFAGGLLVQMPICGTGA